MSHDLTAHDKELIPAATVLLVRDTADTPEVLMLRRNSKIAFGGMWVFPGGRVDDGELDLADPTGSARRAAIREVNEETGLDIAGAELTTWSYWIPPPMPSMKTNGPRRRFSTWFFITRAPTGDVAIDYGEIHEHRWLTASAAVDLHTKGEIELAPPTWVTLQQLARHATLTEALSWANTTDAAEFRTRPIRREPVVLAWAGDSAYETGDVDLPGPRNRLIMASEGWRYESTVG